MPLITYTLPLDLESEAVNSPQAVIEVSKGDSNRQIVAVLFDDGQPYYPGDNAYALFSCPRRPGYDIIGPCTIIGNAVYYTFNDQTSALVGTWPCQILIYDSDGTELHTRSFTLKVYPAAYRRDVVQASSEFGGLSSIVADFLQRSIGLETAINAKLGLPELYEALTGEEANAGVTIQDALAPLVTEDELTEAVRGLENNLAVDGAVYNALRAFVLQKTLEEMMLRYQELLTPELFGAMLERGGYYMSYDAVNRRLRATVGGVSMAALMLSGCLTTGGKSRLANYLDHGVFVATDSAAAQIEDDINHLVAELTEAVEHTINVSLPSLTSYVVSTVSGVSGAAANIAVVVPPAGTTRTVTITPVNGREITGVIVTGCDYTVTENADGSRTVVLQLTANTESVVVTAATSVIRTIRNLFVSVNLPLYGGMSDVYGLYTGDYSSDQTYGDLRKYLTVTADYDTADGTEDGVVITSYSFDGHPDGDDLPDGNQITVSITVDGITARFKLMPFEQDNIVSVTPSQSLLNIKVAAGTALSALDDKYVLNVKFEHNSGTVPVKLNTLTDEGAIRWGANSGNVAFGTNTRSVIYDGATAPIQLQITGCMKVACAGIGAVYRAGRFDEADTVTGGYYLADPSFGFEIEIEAAERYTLTGADGLSASIGSTSLTSKFVFADNKYRAELDVDEWWSLANQMEVPVMTIVINPTATEVNMATLTGGALMIDGLFGNEVSGALVVDIS